MAESVEIFLSYARKDEAIREELVKQLRRWEREGLITIWHDRNISAGVDWASEIHAHLNSAQVILLLISPDFMASDYCYGVEVKRAMERYEAGDARVIPVILRPVNWQDAPFGKLRALPTDGTPILGLGWHSLDEAIFNVAEGIHQAILEIVDINIVRQKVDVMGHLAKLTVLLRDYLTANVEFAESSGSDIEYPISKVQEALVILADIMGKVAKATDSNDISSNLEKAEKLLQDFSFSMYCVKCDAKVKTMIDARVLTMKNGRPAVTGKCPKCGTLMFKINVKWMREVST